MRKCIPFVVILVAVFTIYCPHAMAESLTGPYDWGTDGVASTDRVEGILQLTPAADQWAEWVDWYNSGALGEIPVEPVTTWSWDLWPYYYPASQGQDWVQCWGVNPWSADGQWIIYTSAIPSYFQGDGDCGYWNSLTHNAICRIHPDGTGYEQLTSNNKGETQGSFLGPDNNTIVFKRGPRLYKKDLTSGAETDLTETHRDEAGILHGDWAGEEEEAFEKTKACEVTAETDLKASEEEGGQPAEGHPSPSPDGSKIAFHRQGTVWVMDADGTNATYVAGKRVDIPVNSNLQFLPNGSGGFTMSVPETFTWENDKGAPLDICCGQTPEADISFQNFTFPFAGKTYGAAPALDAKAFFAPAGLGVLYVSTNGHVSLGGSNSIADGGCNCGGPDKLLNGQYARIAPFWTHLARQLHINFEDCEYCGDGSFDPETDCPDYAVYVNAFDGETAVPIVTYSDGEGCGNRYDGTSWVYSCACEYDYFDYFDVNYDEVTSSWDYEIDRFVITWWNLKLVDNDKRLSVQLQLFDDGRILMAYKFDGTDDYEINSLKKVLIGVSPGHPSYETFSKEDPTTWIVDPVNPAGIDITAVTAGGATYNSGAQASVYELFYKVHGANKFTWSPNSQWLTFNGSAGCALFTDIFEGESEHSWACPGGKQRIFKVQADGYGLTMLSDLGETGVYENNWPVWSPDGNWIAYHYHDFGADGIRHNADDVFALKRMSAVDGSGKEVVAAQGDFYGVCGPSTWSPDSQWIAFKRGTEDGYSIFMVNVSTGEEVQLTEGYDDARLWWSPVNGEILFRDADWGAIRDGGADNDDLLLLTLKQAVRGDVNGDGVVDKTDLYILIGMVGKAAPGPEYDLDGDGIVTVADLKLLVAENPALARDTRLRRLIR